MSPLRSPLPKKMKMDSVDSTLDHDLNSFEALPSNTLLAIQVLASQFPYLRSSHKVGGIPNIPPIILRSQIYSVMSNRTEVDRELDDLKKGGHNNAIRMFRLPTSEDEFAVVFTDHLIEQINEMKKTKFN